MALRVVQPGAGERRLLVLAYFVADTADLLEALPKAACVLADIDDGNGRFARPPGAGGVDPIESALGRARTHAGDFEPSATLLIAWSAGCQAPRELLRAGARPEGILALDGVSGSVPPTEAQLAPWRAHCERARAGEAVFVLAHTMMGYTEHLAPAQRYASTTHMAAEITGTAGSTPAPAGEIEPVEGSLYVCAYPSKDIDAPAHIRQQREVMPDLLRRVVVPWLERRIAEAPPSPPPEVATPVTLGERAVAVALAELAAGVCEVPAHSNTGPRIREYLAPCWLTAGAWCAAGFCWTARRALAPGEKLPHAYTAAVRVLVQSARACGTWHDKGDGYVPKVGDGVVLARDGGDPTTGGLGHVARVVVAPDEAGAYEGVEGNHLDRWGRVARNLADEDLRGFIEYP